jgi:hypothetical protein
MVSGDSVFTFLVNRQRLSRSIVEAILVSPAIHRLIVNDLSVNLFVVNHETIHADDLFAYCGATLSLSNIESLLTVSRV